MSADTFILSNARIFTPHDEGMPLRGAKSTSVREYRELLVEEGRVAELSESGFKGRNIPRLDCGGALVTPALVDPHTHALYGGSRESELPLKLAGADYMEIHRAGGGIASTVRATRAASSESLLAKAKNDLEEMQRFGVTTVEIKSGYGLDFETEIKTLKIIRELQDIMDMNIVSTFMGAHSVPEEYKGNTAGYIDFQIREIMPAVADMGLAEFCDVFCEEGVFSVEETREIFKTARELGFKLKIHADEIASLGGAELAAEMKLISADHLMAVSDAGIQALSAPAAPVAVLLPGTSFYLRQNYAPARRMLDSGVAVALASDYNPGSCPSLNMQFILNLAYLYLRMKPEEILTAATLNAAYAVDRAKRVGSLDVGKDADFIIWNADNLEYPLYRFGQNLVKNVYRQGRKII